MRWKHLLLSLAPTSSALAHRTSPSIQRSISKSLERTHLPVSVSQVQQSIRTMSSNANAQKSDEEWRAILSPQQFRVIREKGTEGAGSGKLNKHYPSDGDYHCAACDAPLYKATTKFDSGCGWPAFFEAIPGAVTRHEDNNFGMVRTEIVCTACGGHLGHVFKGEGFKNPVDERHCVNSVSLTFKDADGTEVKG